ncbi:hypothetical protein L6164_021550 [Bauhinia variegata]|uniref:Uncharacterized protein n=1 Tax=Bauhinia variegata TaxID=167791 RepID=A0ACB9N2P7_BAUVA|nr:hypothetical protein L6164_021550 [Bauhinia variegata]
MATQSGERRRRIAERGSDRMALITGQIQNLPPLHPNSPRAPTSSAYHLRYESLSIPIDHGKPSPSTSSSSNLHLRHESLPVSALSRDHPHSMDHSGVDGLKHVATRSVFGIKRETEFPSRNNFNFNSEVEPLIKNFNAKGEVSPAVGNDEDKTKQSEGARAQKAAIDAELHTLKAPNAPVPAEQHALRPQKAIFDMDKLLKLGRLKPSFFSSGELHFCIIASERTRAKFALVIALLIVLFYGISESVEVLRPLCIVLLTDVTIVLSLLLEKASASEAAEGEKVVPNEDGDNWIGAVKLLERALVAYQAMRGFFIDCSVYVVVVICCTSFM